MSSEVKTASTASVNFRVPVADQSAEGAALVTEVHQEVPATWVIQTASE
jgi:hypothetical protein